MLSPTHILVFFLSFTNFTFAQLYKLRISLPTHSLDNAEINASGRSFYTGLSSPATYCPSVVNPNCPNNTVGGTVFAGLIGLRVMVPGGQQIYVAPDGAMGFTQAHSASVPDGSYRTGWTKTDVPNGEGVVTSIINWKDPEGVNTGIFACLRQPARASQRARYQIYANTKDFIGGVDCVELDGLRMESLPDNTPIGFWQNI